MSIIAVRICHAAGGKCEYDKENTRKIFFVFIHFLSNTLPLSIFDSRDSQTGDSRRIYIIYIVLLRNFAVYACACITSWCGKIIGQLKSRYETAIFVVVVIAKSQLRVRYKYYYYTITYTHRELSLSSSP